VQMLRLELPSGKRLAPSYQLDRPAGVQLEFRGRPVQHLMLSEIADIDRLRSSAFLVSVMRLFHFSENGDIGLFEPRPVAVPAPRAPGSEWLNGPLVWAIDGWHQPMYLFPRDCPRILLWPVADTSADDLKSYWGTRSCRMVAYIESGWFEILSHSALYRYELPPDAFESLGDAGMWAARSAVEPVAVQRIDDLPDTLRAHRVELVVAPSLIPLRKLWSTSLHVSGIRLRNANGWAANEPSGTPNVGRL
jgi:hypothetical protein